ncbi:MAG: hypothetical protein EAZ57_03690 [Cytophagales bacterium]|nr:MAG: hypothetical protein EAZ67_04700 [Cytophagales bacterium]TAF61313.1 MAG: hypothetical protein EAZ57_03690 [Cytophagales bacterium]
MKHKLLALTLIGCAFACFLGFSCTKEIGGDVPENPFLKIDYSDTIPVPPELLDPNTIEGLHQTLFKNRCAVPACHDGAFEPDFRTVQSSYSTLVFHPITKNNAAKSFSFRVVPYDSKKSVLYERITNCCFVNTNDRMPQDNIGKPLEDKYINAVKTWIDRGAPDMFGNVNLYPNRKASLWYYFCLTEDLSKSVSDTDNRIDSYGAFRLENNKKYKLFFAAQDDSTAIRDLSRCRIEISEDALDFSSAREITCEYFGPVGFEGWFALINTSILPKDKTLYFRIYINDNNQKRDTETPNKDSPSYFFRYFSFYVAS